MLDINKRKEMFRVTIEDVIAELEKFPKGTEVYCNGSELFYIHAHKDGNAITFDDSDLSEYYEDEFAIEYTETYSDVYYIKANSYEEACKKLQESIINGDLDGPDQCCDSLYKNVSNKI